MIIDEIKKASIIALKEKDQIARAIYSVVANKVMVEEIKKREKKEQLTDIDVIQILQKTVKELTDEAENYSKVGNLNEVEKIEKQKALLEKHLPQMMTAEEIHSIISEMTDKSIGNVMKHFKTTYAGKCDMRLVGNIVKKLN